MSNVEVEKFAQWKEHLERSYGKGTFFSKSWLRRQLNRAAPTVSREVETLPSIQADLGDCHRCKLGSCRTKIVFGEGSPTAELMFIGEGPGEDEDLSGRPFLGKAGELLDKIIEAMGFKRADVYLANVVKCRTPDSRAPEPTEVAECEKFLLRQIEVVRPRIIVALGGTALKLLLRDEEAKTSLLRGTFLDYRGARLMPTFHPSYLLRNPEAKKEVWEDMKKVKAELGSRSGPG